MNEKMIYRDELIDRTPLLQAIKHYQYAFEQRPLHIHTPHGQAIPQEWRYSVQVSYAAYMKFEHRQELGYKAREQVIMNASRELTYALAGQQLDDMVRVPAKYQSREWLMLCSHETFYRFLEAEPYHSEFNFIANSYIYDGLHLYRHSLPTDILINTERSAIYNLECLVETEWTTEDIQKLTLIVRAFWLIDSPTAKPLE